MSALLERGAWVIQQKKEWGEILSENGEALALDFDYFEDKQLSRAP